MTAEPFLNPALVAVASRQHGVFSAAQAYGAGHVQKELQRLRETKKIVSVRRGVYASHTTFATAKPADQHRMRVAALALRLTGPAVLSHQSAAAEHGLELLQADYAVLHVTRSETSGTRVEAGVKHHMAELAAADHVRLDGGLIDVTTLARTAMDVARSTDRLECAVAAFDSALRMGVPPAALAAEQRRARSWPGARMASRALPLADGRAANPGESWSRVILIRLGLAPLDLQVRMEDEDGLIGYADFGWDGVIGELDGKGKYGVDAATDPLEAGRIVFKEKKREDRARRLGLGVARWVFADHYHPEVIGSRVRQAMSDAARSGRAAG